MLYRIYTEDINRNKIEAAANNLFDGFTLIPAIGYWKGIKENSIIIEIFTTDVDSVFSLADQIKEFNNQEAVLVVSVFTREP